MDIEIELVKKDSLLSTIKTYADQTIHKIYLIRDKYSSATPHFRKSSWEPVVHFMTNTHIITYAHCFPPTKFYFTNNLLLFLCIPQI